MSPRLACISLVSTVALVSAALAHAQHSEGDLAKATQNPVADLTTVPFQFNWLSGGDLDDRTLSILNVQPVLPLPINERWNVIARTIVPMLNVPLAGDERATGIGDIQGQFYFTPANPGGLIWGVGPVVSLPTATNEAVNTGQFAAGPGVVLVKMTGPWVLGAVGNNIWRVGGSEDTPEINAFTLQPFINLNFTRGWSLAFSPVFTANWSAPSGEEWTVPLGLGLSKVTAVGKLPTNVSLQYYNNVERPTGTGEHQVRLQFALLFPKVAG